MKAPEVLTCSMVQAKNAGGGICCGVYRPHCSLCSRFSRPRVTGADLVLLKCFCLIPLVQFPPVCFPLGVNNKPTPLLTTLPFLGRLKYLLPKRWPLVLTAPRLSTSPASYNLVLSTRQRQLLSATGFLCDRPRATSPGPEQSRSGS